MEDIVGIRIKDSIKGEGAFITWGRLFDAVDDTKLLNIIKDQASLWGIYHLETIELCYSLQEIADQPYFHECLIKFIQEPIPYGEGYDLWKSKKKRALKKGKDIYFTGFMNDYKDYLKRKKLMS